MPHEKNNLPRVICVIRNGCLESVYSNTPCAEAELLDYDNMHVLEEDSDEYQYYRQLETELETGKLYSIF